MNKTDAIRAFSFSDYNMIWYNMREAREDGHWRYIYMYFPPVMNIIRTTECSSFLVYNPVLKNDFHVQRTILGLSTEKTIFRMK